jgi:hypothetical protein
MLLEGWFGAHDGDPNDAHPGIGELHAGFDGDYIVVTGDWVYDAGHAPGWNEFHPCKSVQKIPNAPYWIEEFNPSPPMFQDEFKNVLKNWCEQTKKADDPNVQDEQKDPKNHWCTHPVVDGCQPDEVPAPPQLPK